MTRTPVATRRATVADITVVAQLCQELRTVGGRAERAMSPILSDDLEARLEELVADDNCRVVLAYLGDRPGGMAVMRLVRPDPLSGARMVQLSHLVVAPGERHRGVGHALIEAASAFALEHHVDQVAASVYPSLRDASRFYARLGFAPAATHRVAPVALLRRRLGIDRGASSSDAMRRRTRLLRPVPPQRLRTQDRDRV